MSYAELDVLTNFSFLRGGSHPSELAAEARLLGLAAIAVTDANTLAGAVRMHVAANDVGIRLVVGCRLDCTLENGIAEPYSFPSVGEGRRTAPAGSPISLLAWPRDRAAHGRLCRLLSLGQLRSQKGQCQLTLADVAAHQEGMIFALRAPDGWPGEAFEAALASVREAIGERLYLAASRLYRGRDRARLNRLAGLARRHGAPFLATNSVLYHHAARKPLQDVLTCIREKCTIKEAGLRLEANAERHLKGEEEMLRLFQGHEEAVERTLEVAEACRFSLSELRYEYPDEPVPAGSTPQAQLEKLVREGAAWRYPRGVPEKVEAVLAKELKLIEKLDYARYFLTVHDIVAFARSKDILCQGRGSAANSAVCYCLGVTSVDPSEIELLFERFISEERKEPPDIDVDFEHERREEVIQYLYARYGRERASLAATVICYRGRSAVREVGKAMGLSEDVTSRLAGIVWGRARDELTDFQLEEQGLDRADPLLARVIELSEAIQGFPRHLSQHVGGFVLTRGRLDEVVPIGNAAMQERTFIEWDKDDIDALGMLKVDVLGLGMLTCIRKCFDLIEGWTGRKYTLAEVPGEDPEVYDMLCRADSVGVFQVESRAQMNMLPRLKPRKFYDLVIEVAIVRPGPIQGDMVHPYLRRRQGLEPEEYPAPHPEHGPPDELRAVLGRTKGVPLFQEQAMKLAMVAAQFTPGELNELRRAMATFRRVGTIGRLEKKMVERMVERGYQRSFAERCFGQIKGFGEYGFPESHAASFALLVYVSAWLKRHHPAAFAAALLNSQPMGFYAPAQIVRDATEHGVEALPPDVNFSQWDATLERRDPSRLPPGERGFEPALRLGLRSVDGLPEAEGRRIAETRTPSPLVGEGGRRGTRRPDEGDGAPAPSAAEIPLTLPSLRDGPLPLPRGERGSFYRFLAELQSRAGLSVAAIEKLAAADAFRSLGLDRRHALWQAKALSSAKSLPLFDHAKARATGEEPPVTLPAMPRSEHVVNDYQTLKLSLKGHPMGFLRADCLKRGVTDNHALKAVEDGRPVVVAGVVLIRQRPGSAKGVVFITLEDEHAVCNIVVWPPVLERFRSAIMGARLMLVKGRVQKAEGILHVVAREVEDLTGWLARLSEDLKPAFNPLAHTGETTGRLPARRQAPRHPRQVRVIPKSRDFH